MTDKLLPCPFCHRDGQQTLSSGLVSCAFESCPAFLLAVPAESWNTRAAPRQPEGDAISRERVQAEADAFFDWPTADKSSVTTTSCLIFARCIAGMVAAERDATIAELREVNRIQLEIAEVHGAACVEIRKERNTLRQQLAERDAEIMEQCRLDGMGAERELKLMAQRDKLARLLADVKADYTHAIHWGDLHATMKRIDAALAEIENTQ